MFFAINAQPAMCGVMLLGLALALPERAAAQAMATTGGSRVVFNIRDYGAKGDGKTLDSPAINEAIAACAGAGGGTVWIPAGRYLSGSIRLTNNLNLHIDAGAVIVAAPQSLKAYDETEPWEGKAYQDGGHTFFRNSLIWGENLTNVFITGPGLIHGEGLSGGDGQQDLRTGYADWQNPNSARPDLPPDRLGNKAIALKLCRNVTLRDFTILRGGHFGILATGCDNLTIDNITMDTNRDGMNVDCCRNVTISNCRINSPDDDAICLKSTFALKRNVVTENVTIVNCQVSAFERGTLLDGTMKPARWPSNGRIKLGTESNGGFRNITIANCTFRECRGLALEQVDGGIMENITVNNIVMMNAPYPIYITTGKRNRGPDVTTTSSARNIFISNVIATGVGMMSGIVITGLPGQSMERIRLDNIYIEYHGGGTAGDRQRMPKELGTDHPEPDPLGVMPSYGMFVRHVRDIQVRDVQVSYAKPDFRHAIVGVNVEDLNISNFKAKLEDGVVPARFHQVKGLVVQDSPNLEGWQME